MITQALTPNYRLRPDWTHWRRPLSLLLLVLAGFLLLTAIRPANSAALAAPNLDIQATHPGNTHGTTADLEAQTAEVQNEAKLKCINPPADMVAWWPFDESSGPSAQDISGFNNQGTHINGPTPVAGKVAGALCFDGANHYVEVADHPDINFLGDCSNDAAEAFTIDAWVRTSQSSGLAVILDKRSTGPVGYHLFLFNGRLGFQMAIPGSFTNFVAPASGPQFVNVANGSWNLVTVTATRCRGGQGRLYVNGNLVLSFVPLVGGLNNTAKLNIGRRDPAFGASPFRGCIDELEIFKRALSNTEVMALFNAGSKGKCKSSPSPLGSLTARVVDRKGRPVQGVAVQAPDREPVTTNANGEFTLKKLAPTERLAVSFSAKGL